MVHGGIVTPFPDSLIEMRYVPIVCRLGRTATFCFRIDYLKTVAPCEDQCAKLIIVILFRQSPVARRAWRHQGRIVRKHRDNFPNRRH